MSAPALRAPARWHRVARAHLAASAPAALLGLAAFVVFTLPGTKNLPTGRDGPLVEVSEAVALMLFLPLLHWRGRGGSRSLDQGLPVGQASQEWIRTVCGALWAALTVGVALAIHLLTDTRLRTGAVTVEPALPISILATHLGTYLLGAAVLLRTDRPGRTLVLTMLLVGTLGALGEPFSRSLWSSHTVTHYVAGHKHVSVPGWPRATLLPLALGLGAMAVSTRLGRHGEAFAGVRARWMAIVHRDRPAPRTRAPRVTAGPRSPAPFGRALLRQFLALRSRLGWGAMIVVALYAPMFFDIAMSISAVGIAASFWPALVWMEERGRRRDWDESLPLGRLPLRTAHALAGGAWLAIAAVPGALLHPAGIAVPVGALVLYLISTVGVALLGRPVLACFVMMIVGSIASIALAPEHPLSLARAHAPLDTPPALAWSPAAALVWLALLAAAAVAALHVQARRDHSGRTWLPRLRSATQPT